MIPPYILDAQCGDAEAWTALWEHSRRIVFRVCYRFYSHSGAEDAAQEIFIKLFNKLHQFRGDSAYSTWLYNVAWNYCANELRKKRLSVVAFEDVNGEDRRVFEPAYEDVGLRTVGLEESVGRIMARMPGKLSGTLTQLYVDDKLCREIAAEQNVSLQCVKSRAKRARERFKREWRREYGEGY